MAKPSPTPVARTARTWHATLADGRHIGFSSPIDQVAERLTVEARTENTTITSVTPAFPIPRWAKLHGEIVIRLCSNKAMTINDGRADRAA